MADPFSVTASVLGVLQFGLSAAKILKNYTDAVRDAPRDVRDFANIVETTFQQAKQLQVLVDDNPQTQRFSAANLAEAQKCCLKARELGDELWTFLKKQTRGDMPQGQEVKEDDIELRAFQQSMWYFNKTKVQEKEKKFNLLKSDIALVLGFLNVGRSV